KENKREKATEDTEKDKKYYIFKKQFNIFSVFSVLSVAKNKKEKSREDTKAQRRREIGKN
ncbi:unnamed protein product, partial [marine sediment metagenome]